MSWIFSSEVKAEDDTMRTMQIVTDILPISGKFTINEGNLNLN